jgi:hypothetical protein
VALAVATPPFPWYAMLLVMLVAFDGRVEWLGFAMVRYVAVSDPLPGVRVPVLDTLRAAYGLALAVVVAVALIRWRRAQAGLAVQPVPVVVPEATAVPAPALPAPALPAPAPEPTAVPAASSVSAAFWYSTPSSAPGELRDEALPGLTRG